jgi:hypothetical protein
MTRITIDDLRQRAEMQEFMDQLQFYIDKYNNLHPIDQRLINDLLAHHPKVTMSKALRLLRKKGLKL